MIHKAAFRLAALTPILVVWALGSVPFKSERASASQEVQPLAVLEAARAAYEQVQDYRCVFSKTEQIEGKMVPQKMDMWFKKPFSVKFVWIDPKKGQKASYTQGHNENRIRARKGGFLSMFAVNLDPLEKRAMEDNRHPITHAGIGFLIDKTFADIGKGQYELRYLGEETIDGRPCHHIEFLSQGEKGYHYGLRSEFWIDKELQLPIQSKHFDYDNTWIETYTYGRLQVNVGLQEKDFEI